LSVMRSQAELDYSTLVLRRYANAGKGLTATLTFQLLFPSAEVYYHGSLNERLVTVNP
jgi:hypothetical protein